MANKLNIKLAKKCKLLDKEIKQVTPAVYASIAISMYENNYSVDDINRVFQRSQELWEEHQAAGSVDDMLSGCEEKTGICIVYK